MHGTIFYLFSVCRRASDYTFFRVFGNCWLAGRLRMDRQMAGGTDGGTDGRSVGRMDGRMRPYFTIGALATIQPKPKSSTSTA